MTFLMPLFHVVSMTTMILLVGCSVWSIGIIIDRRRAFRTLADPKEYVEAQQIILSEGCKKVASWTEGRISLVAGVLRTVCDEPSQSALTIEAAARSFLQKERQKLEKGLNVLATLGSNAPFIGLFGTVLGIIEAFSVLSTEQAGSGRLMASISEALIATAAGLFVAIPAVIAFNFFTSKLRNVISDCESLKNLYLSKLPRRS